MLISDFTLKERNVAPKGEEPIMEIWQTAAGGNLTAIGYKGGKKYQIKLHASEPKWYYTDKAIAKKQAELDSASPADKVFLQRELASLISGKARNDKNDAAADGYFDIKTNLIRALNAIGDPLIVAPIGIWKQEVRERGNAVLSVEASPWAEHAYMGGDFDEDSPLVFTRDPSLKQQYELMASLAGRVAKLHEHGIIHGDLKIGNTLMVVADGRFQAALIDFDAAILLNDLYSRKYGVKSWRKAVGGTYFSPEAMELFDIVDAVDAAAFDEFDMKSVTTKSDIFGLGVTVYEYFFGRADMGKFLPFVNADGESFAAREYCEAEKHGYTLALPDTVNDFLYAIIGWMLDPSPENRPTARQVESAFISGDVALIPEQYRKTAKKSGKPVKASKSAKKEEDRRTEEKVKARETESTDRAKCIELSNKLEALQKEIQQNIEMYEATPDVYDDNIGEIYKVFDDYVQVFKASLLKYISYKEYNAELAVPDGVIAETKKACSLFREVKDAIDRIGEDYIIAMGYYDEAANILELYNIAEYKDLQKLVKEYEEELFNFYSQLEDEDISDVDVNKIAVVCDTIKALCEQLEKLYVEIKNVYKSCQKALNNAVNSDVEKVMRELKYVKPSVPEYATNGVVFVPDMNISCQYKTLAWSSIKGKIATLALSSIFEPYIGMPYNGLMEIVKAHGGKFYWCSLATFKELELISESVEAVFIVDDGYEDFGIEPTVFSRLKSWLNCFDKKDSGRIFFSESAAKKLKSILR